MKYQINIMRYK